MRFPSGNALQRLVVPVLVVAAAVQIGALWIVNGRIVTSTQHSLNAQSGQIAQAGTTAQEAQAEIDSLLLDIRGLQATISGLRGTTSSQGAENTSLQNQITALEQALQQLQVSSASNAGSSAGSSGGSGPTPPSPTQCHGGPRRC